MKNALLLTLMLCVPLAARSQTASPQAAPEPGLQRVTLYGPLARGHDDRRALFSFKMGTYGPGWDLGYGSLYVGAEHDWFQVSTAKGVRTALRDLGAHDWADTFGVPFVEPFPKLKEGEQRRIVVNADGADGKPGRSAGPEVDGEESLRGDFPQIGVVVNTDTQNFVEPPKLSPKRPAPGPRRDGVPKVDPVYARAIPGHMYVIHVVDDVEDFYVLFRVESLVRGDNCTISWKRVPAPGVMPAGKH
jgi:hypothetical protein